MGKYVVIISSLFVKPCQQCQEMPLSAVSGEHPSYGKKDVLKQIRDVIRETTMPSWFGSVPRNFGDISAGTIKADEWHSLITVYIPIALISLWGGPSSKATLKSILDHTMDLVSAVYVSCARTMTLECATAYRSYIASYVRSLRRIHPTSNVWPCLLPCIQLLGSLWPSPLMVDISF